MQAFHRLRSAAASSRNQFAALSLLYLPLAYFCGARVRYELNPDAIAYFRLAEYVAEGQWLNSVNDCWSPLFSWCLAPMLWLGVDAPVASRIVLGIWGYLLIIGVWFFAKSIGLNDKARFLCTLIAVLIVPEWAASIITPDMPLTALLLCYLALMFPTGRLDFSRCFLAGALAGLAFLAKTYAFPFFLIHFPISLLFHAHRGRWGFDRSNARLAAAGFAGWIIFALPWIIVLSLTYGKPGFGQSGHITHAFMGPQNPERHYPFRVGLHPPRPGTITIWENPTDLEWPFWSPFASKANFKHQLQLVRENTGHLFRGLQSSPGDPFRVRILALLLLPVLAVAFRSTRSIYFWTAATIIVYCGGYLLTLGLDSRYYWIVILLLIMVSYRIAQDLAGSRFGKTAVLGSLVLLTLCYGYKPAGYAMHALRSRNHVSAANPHQQASSQLVRAGCRGAFATIGFGTGEFLAYYMKRPFLGSPMATTPSGVADELAAAGGQFVLVFGRPGLADSLSGSGFFIRRGSALVDDREVHILELSKSFHPEQKPAI